MNNFYTNPKEAIIKDMYQMFGTDTNILTIAIEEIHEMMTSADNLVVLTGKGRGGYRVSSAIEDAVLHICQVANGYDLFTATHVMIKLTYSKKRPCSLSELSDICTFEDMFYNHIQFVFGICELDNNSDKVIAMVAATNIKQIENQV